jgi:predicted transcriptional regulator
MNKKGNIEGQFTKSKVVLTETETTRKVEMEIPKNEAENVQASLLKVNHARGLYEDFFTLNQQFMLYVLSIGLKGKEWEVFVWFLARMDYGNKILINQELIVNELNISQSQASKALRKLRENKIILETKYNVAKYEVSFNYDVLNPVAAFKGKASKQNIANHKALIEQESPYQKHYNIEGNIDLINGITGEIFETIESLPQDKEKNQKIAFIQAKERK